MRNHYWTCSKFADWLRGTASPGALTSKGWREWREAAQKKHPVRYWLADEGLDYLQTVVFYIPDKLYGLKYYINNRFVTRTHALTAHPRDIAPGDWCDVGNRFLPCLFNELRDFVEVELAWWNVVWDEEAQKKFNAPFYSYGWWRWRVWRCPESGLDNLRWQIALTNVDYVAEDHPDYGKPTPQAERAQEILDLYNWWTVTYRNRPDPYEASGWSAYCEANRAANGGRLSFSAEKTPELRAMNERSHELLNKIEAEYEAEDEAMLIRLIKIRGSLWT
jgi:hypothetical protein